MVKTDGRHDGVSHATDELSSTLLGDAFDLIAEGEEMGVLVVVADAKGNTASFELTDDGQEALLAGARERVKALAAASGDAEVGLGAPVRYALVYEGAIADGAGIFQDAVILEFGEKGYKSYSAYSYVKGRGEGERFCWSDPAPAGEVEPLL